MKQLETKIIIGIFLFIIICFAVANIIKFSFLEFYSMVVMMFFLLKYLCIKFVK